jgi:hypothetical protein
MHMKDSDRESEEVKETMIDVYRGFEALDAEELDANFAHSPELIAFGTDWDEKFLGWDQYQDVHRIQFNALKSFKFEEKGAGCKGKRCDRLGFRSSSLGNRNERWREGKGGCSDHSRS